MRFIGVPFLGSFVSFSVAEQWLYGFFITPLGREIAA
jgi:hypothetical protein